MIDNILRDFIWAIGGVFLGLSDGIFSVLKTIAGFNITALQGIWDWWTILSVFIGMFISFRVFKMVFKVMSNEEYAEKIKWANITFRLIPIMLIITLLPITIKYVGEGSQLFVDNVAQFVGSDPDLTISEIIINAASFKGDISEQFGSGEETTEAETEEVVEEVKATYSLKEINENINHKVDGKYVHFPTYPSLFLGIICGALIGWMMVQIAIEVAKRSFSIVAKILISPIPIANLIDPEDTTFSKWSRSLITDYISNFIQILLIYVVLILSNSASIVNLGTWVQLIFLIAGLLVVQSGVPALAEIIGVDISANSSMGSLAQLGQASGLIGMAGAGVGFLGGAALTGAAMATHSGLKMGEGIKNKLTGASNLMTGSMSGVARTMGDMKKESGVLPTFSQAGGYSSHGAKSSGGRISQVLAGLDNLAMKRMSQSGVARTLSRPFGAVLNHGSNQGESFSSDSSQSVPGFSDTMNNQTENLSSTTIPSHNFETSQGSTFTPSNDGYYDREPLNAQSQAELMTQPNVRHFDQNGNEK